MLSSKHKHAEVGFPPHLQVATEAVDAVVCVDAVVDGVGDAFALSLVWGRDGGRGLDGCHAASHTNICPVTKRLDGVYCEEREKNK